MHVCVRVHVCMHDYDSVGSSKVSVKLNTQTATVRVLQDAVLKGGFGMVAPDVEIDDGKGL